MSKLTELVNEWMKSGTKIGKKVISKSTTRGRLRSIPPVQPIRREQDWRITEEWKRKHYFSR
jgi:hypothetical protein